MSNDTDERKAALSPARRALLELRMRKGDAGDAPIPRRQDRGPAPLSFAQQRLWLLDQLVPGNHAYNVPRALRLKGALDVPALEKAIGTIVQRHEVLRTPFAWEDGSVVQVVLGTTADVPLRRIDLSHLAAPARQAKLSRRLVEELQRPFDLSRDVMLRATLFCLAEAEHVLLVVTHHIASDGWSKGVLFRELSVLYDAFATGAPSPLPELPIQYADFALWQRQRLSGEVLFRLLAYFRAHLEGAPPALELPTFRQRPATQTYRGEKQYPVLQRALSEQLKALAQREGATLFMLLMAAFKALLYRYTGQGDVVVGTPIAGRSRPETEGLIGFFMNTLVLRTDLSDNPTFRELLQRERGVLLGAYEHQELPFEKLVAELSPERDLSRSPLIQVMFLFDVPTSLPILRGLDVTAIEVDTGAAKYDLILGFSEGPNGLTGKIEYNTDLFDAATITRFLGHFEALLESVVDNADQRVLELSILRPEERALLLGRWNQTRAEVPRDLCVQELIFAQAARTPDAPAVIFEGKEISYRELSQRSHQLANYLRKRGVGPGALVGIATGRSIDMVVGLLGILNAGAAYVPIDPSYPRDRIAFMLSDAKVSLLLTDAETAALLPVDQGEQVRLDADAAAIARESADPPESGVTATDLAYVIYTSGSTGHPKGVQISHRAVVNLLTSMRDRPGISEKDAVVAVTSLSFDIAGLEIYLPLMVGACLVVVSREVAYDGARLLELLDHPQHPCSFLQATPATFQLLLEAGWEGRRELKVLVGGEALRQDLAEKLVERAGSVWNMYGPTETTIWSCVHALPSATSPPSSRSPASLPPPPLSLALKAGPVLIGRPIANTELYILDQQLSPVPVGVAGELFIGGEGLARGYLRRPELTEAKFIRHPFRADASARLFRTGDLCRYWPDGSVDFLGRIDDQVKLRGFRIELGEIETGLAAHPAVRQCVVVVREDAPGQRRLVAYLVTDPAAALPLTTDLRAHLQKSLPEIMIPSAFVVLPALPLTPNGKIHRRGLPPPEAAGRVEAESTFVAPSGPLEETIAAIFREVLHLPRISTDANFFGLGGHSLLVMQVIRKVHAALDVQLSMRNVFEAPSIASLAAAVAKAQADRGASGLSAALAEPSEEELGRMLAELDRLSEEEAERLLESGAEADGDA
jgi:amino acid adenylation domain-containing protein